MAALLGVAALTPSACASEPTAAQHLASVPLTVRGHGRTARFRVEVARTLQQQEIGLMFRKSMAPMAGMVFPMDPPRTASFWMKNTLIPLDIIFIRPDHTIGSIAAEVPALQTFPTVDSREPVIAVLELNAGAAKRNHLSVGDSVRW